MNEQSPLHGRLHAIANSIRTEALPLGVTVAAMIDEIAAEVGGTHHRELTARESLAAQLADAEKLAATRLQVCQSQAAMIVDYREKLDNSNRRWLKAEDDLEGLRTGYSRAQSEIVDLSDQIAEFDTLLTENLNPPDGDAAAIAIYSDAVERIVAYVVKQPCSCDATEVRLEGIYKACERCSVLGRALDERVER